MDLWMLSDRKPTNDYGIDTSEWVNALLGLTSLFLWILWIAFAFGLNKWLFLHTVYLMYQNVILQYIGIFLTTIAVLIAISARIARGKYAPSWGLHNGVKLATKGPYRFIRHPNYLFYCLAFIGIPLFTGFIPGLILSIGIYGYVKNIIIEEQLLIKHFGTQYVEYKKKTWRLMPFLW